MKTFNHKQTWLILLTLLCFSIPALLVNAAVRITAKVDKTEVSLEEQVQLTLSVSGNTRIFGQPSLPGLDSFETYSAGRSQSVSIINGQLSSSIVFTYILVPRKLGEFSLEKVKLGGKTYSVKPIKIKVTKQAPTRPARPRAPSSRSSGRKATHPAGKLFVEGEVDQTTAYVNQQIIYSFRFFRAVNLYENPEFEPADFTGFWIEDLPPQRQYYEMINGRRYLVTEIKTALFPTAPGEYTIEPARLEVMVDSFDGDPFAIFNRSFRASKPQILKTNRLKIKVLPLPGTKPPDFTGAVGIYELETSVDKNKLRVNEPLTYRLKISGQGNIKTIPELELKLPADEFKKYESSSSQDIAKGNYRVSGQKTYEYVLVPQKSGELVIPAVSFSYFNPDIKQYQTIKSKSYTIKVAPSLTKKTPTPLSLPALDKKEIELLSTDINHIKNDLSVGRNGQFYYQSLWLYLLVALPILGIAGAVFHERHLEKIATDVCYARQTKARGQAKKRLRRAEQMLRNNQREFYAEIHKSLNCYLGDKLNIQAAYLSAGEVERLLSERKIDSGLIDEVKDVFSACDRARFAPGENEQEHMKKIYQRAGAVINNLSKAGI